jgi:two-component system LytT family response regulator
VERLPLKTAGGIVVVRPGEIVWVEAADNYVLVHLSNRTLTVRETLSALETRLDSAHFARVSRSALVHLDQVAELQPTFHGDYIVVLRTGARLPLSRSVRGQWSRFLSGGAID